MARAPFKLRSQGSPFKEVGSTPKTEINLRSVVDKVKNVLSGDWKTERLKKIAEKAAASPDGLTNFQRRMADRKAQRESGGKSKYQRDIIKRRADRKAEKAMVPIYEGEPGYKPIIQSKTAEKTGHKGGDVLTKNIKDVTDLSVDELRKLFPPLPVHTVRQEGEKIYKAGETDLGDADMHNTLNAGKTKIYNARTDSYEPYTGELLPDLSTDISAAKKRSGFKMKSSPAKIYDKKGKRRKNYKY